MMAMAVCLMTACEKALVNQDDASETKKFTFTLKGDFSDEWKPVTRGYLSADGKDMTDVWVLDYKDGVLVQQLHQSDNTADDFGRPVMSLAYGSHHVYFIASRGLGATLDKDAKTITFTSVRDTYWKDYQVDVVSTSNGNRAVTLDRVVTKLKLSFTDAIADGTATINIIPATWYYGMNYQTGEPTTAATDHPVTINVPDSEIGSTTSASIFGFSTAAEWTTDISINSKKADYTVIGSATITTAPFKANRVSDYSGPLFSAGGSLSLSLNGDWEPSETGTW